MSNTHAVKLASAMFTEDSLKTILRDVLFIEAQALSILSENVPLSLVDAVKAVYESEDTLVVAGIGKSGHIARKIASTFCSIGKQAVFLHAGEASHGDLGVINKRSIVIILSNSGETTELADLISYCEQHQNSIIGITSNADSTLGMKSDITIAYGQMNEACINGLAPTTSTTIALAIGDALAVGVSHLLRIEPEDFRRFHPGGKLGARLMTVGEIMHRGSDLPIVAANTPMSEVVITMSAKGLGVALVQYDLGVYKLITDGDMRRNVESLWQSTANDLAASNKPLTIGRHESASKALAYMTQASVNCLLVIEANQKMCGLLTIHDCLRAGVSQ